jgi:hypothetical protein
MTADLIVGLVVLTVLLVLEGVLPFYTGREERVRHGLRNGTLAVISGAISAALAPVAVVAIQLAERHGLGLARWVDQAAGGG